MTNPSPERANITALSRPEQIDYLARVIIGRLSLEGQPVNSEELAKRIQLEIDESLSNWKDISVHAVRTRYHELLHRGDGAREQRVSTIQDNLRQRFGVQIPDEDAYLDQLLEGHFAADEVSILVAIRSTQIRSEISGSGNPYMHGMLSWFDAHLNHRDPAFKAKSREVAARFDALAKNGGPLDRLLTQRVINFC